MLRAHALAYAGTLAFQQDTQGLNPADLSLIVHVFTDTVKYRFLSKGQFFLGPVFARVAVFGADNCCLAFCTSTHMLFIVFLLF